MLKTGHLTNRDFLVSRKNLDVRRVRSRICAFIPGSLRSFSAGPPRAAVLTQF